MLNVRYCLLQLFLQLFNLVRLVLVFYPFVTDLLLCLKDLFFNWLLVLLPLFLQGLQFLVYCTNLLLQHSQILTSKLFYFLQHLFLLFNSFLHCLECLSHFSLFFFESCLLLGVEVCAGLTGCNFCFEGFKLSDERFNLSLFFSP